MRATCPDYRILLDLAALITSGKSSRPTNYEAHRCATFLQTPCRYLPLRRSLRFRQDGRRHSDNPEDGANETKYKHYV
jgi:hypothetical protein